MFEESLCRIERENNITILYCAEAGSRAQGISSPDSDYDIRFVYVHPVEWYLRLTPGRDTMEWLSEDRQLDFSGWELRKTLNLFAACNIRFNELLFSPVVYREEPRFTQPLRNDIPGFFQANRAVLGYFSLAEKGLASHPLDGPVGLKGYFRIICPLLACRFILNNKAQPPTLFSELIRQSGLSDTLQDRLNKLIELKRTMPKETAVPLSGDLIAFTTGLYREMAALRARGTVMPETAQKTCSKTSLEKLFQRWTLNK